MTQNLTEQVKSLKERVTELENQLKERIVKTTEALNGIIGKNHGGDICIFKEYEKSSECNFILDVIYDEWRVGNSIHYEPVDYTLRSLTGYDEFENGKIYYYGGANDEVESLLDTVNYYLFINDQLVSFNLVSFNYEISCPILIDKSDFTIDDFCEVVIL